MKWREQKEVVKRLIREGISNYELKITKEIKEDRNSGRKLWDNIYKLIGKKTKRNEEMRVFNNEGQELDEQDIMREVPKFWREYLGKETNEISLAWNKEKSEEVRSKREREINSEPSFMIVPGGIFKVKQKITPMELKEIGKDTITGELEKIKSNKAPGPNSLKPVLYKELGKSEFCTEIMAKVYDRQFYSKQIPESWKESKTKLIAKKKKPTVKDFRPIALANISYKLFMSIVKNQIEDHLERNNLTKDNQTGFYKRGKNRR